MSGITLVIDKALCHIEHVSPGWSLLSTPPGQVFSRGKFAAYRQGS